MSEKCVLQSFSTEDIITALKNNDIEAVTLYLRLIGVLENRVHMHESVLGTIFELLHTAVEELDICVSRKTAEDLLYLIAPAIDLSSFTSWLLMLRDPERRPYFSRPSKKLKTVLTTAKTNRLRKMLKKIDEDEYYGILHFIDDCSIPGVQRCLTPPLVEYVYEHELVSIQAFLLGVMTNIESSLYSIKIDYLEHQSKFNLELSGITLEMLDALTQRSANCAENTDSEDEEEE